MNSLRFDNTFWEARLPTMKSASLESKLHLLFSLLVYLGLTVYDFIHFVFSENIKPVKDRASLFLAYRSREPPENDIFHPEELLNLWYERWPAARKYLHTMIQPYAHTVILEESDRIITDPTMRIKIKDLTISDIRDILKPEKLVEKYTQMAPFTFSLLKTFSASPNRYRMNKRQSSETQESDSSASDEEDDLRNAKIVILSRSE